jgi:hypothetical protein
VARKIDSMVVEVVRGREESRQGGMGQFYLAAGQEQGTGKARQAAEM